MKYSIRARAYDLMKSSGCNIRFAPLIMIPPHEINLFGLHIIEWKGTQGQWYLCRKLFECKFSVGYSCVCNFQQYSSHVVPRVCRCCRRLHAALQHKYAINALWVGLDSSLSSARQHQACAHLSTIYARDWLLWNIHNTILGYKEKAAMK